MFELSAQVLAEEESKQRFIAAQPKGYPQWAMLL